MTIQALSNSNVSFGHTKTTKNGNEYQKTHTATRVGLGVGLAGAGFCGYCANLATKDSGFKRDIAKALVGVRNEFMSGKFPMSKTGATKFAKACFPTGMGIVLGGIAVLCLGVGALVNKAINHHRAKAADNAAAAQTK